MFQKNFTKLLLFCVIFSQYIKGNYSECNSFKQTEARVKVHGKSEWKTLSGCLNNLPYEEIYIKDCVKILHQGTFKDMLDLKRIVIEEGNLKEISANFTENTPDLGDISIRKNTLVKLYKNVFPKVLDKLDLTSNRISTVEESAFEDVTVSLLILDDNNLKNIESKWFHNSRIKQLSLNRNQINYIQSNAFNGIKDLVDINLSYNSINYIDDKAFHQLNNLRNLNLTGNTLTHLNFLNNARLTKVDVGFNRISYIFLEKASIQYFFVFPNPWQCNCLQDFWKFAVANNIGVGNTPSTKSTWREVYPVCVAKNPKCTKHENYDDIRAQYFKNVNYAKLDN